MDANNTRRWFNNNECHNIVNCDPTISIPTNATNGFSKLCDEIVMKILMFLPHDDLIMMSQVCTTLSRISRDWTLWKDVYFDKYCKSMENIYLSFMGNYTTRLSITGSEILNVDNSVSFSFIRQLETKCPELLHLSLCNQIFDSNEIFLDILLKKLKSLKLEFTVLKQIENHFLSGFGQFCPNLEDVRITFNDWFGPSCLLDLIKLEKLTYLSLKGCTNFVGLTLYFVGTHYFPNLQTLDLRLTPIDDIEILCFQGIVGLKHLLLERPPNIHFSIGSITAISLIGFLHLTKKVTTIIEIPRSSGNEPIRFILRGDDHIRCKIETLCLRNYLGVNDGFLKKAAELIPSIKFLDVSGTSCTLQQVNRYRIQRPNTIIIFETAEGE